MSFRGPLLLTDRHWEGHTCASPGLHNRRLCEASFSQKSRLLDTNSERIATLDVSQTPVSRRSSLPASYSLSGVLAHPVQEQTVKNLQSVCSLLLMGTHHFELGWFDLGGAGPRVSHAGMGLITSMAQVLIRGQVHCGYKGWKLTP